MAWWNKVFGLAVIMSVNTVQYLGQLNDADSVQANVELVPSIIPQLYLYSNSPNLPKPPQQSCLNTISDPFWF